MSDCKHEFTDYDEVTQITTCAGCRSFKQIDGPWFDVQRPCPCSLCEAKRNTITITKERYQELLGIEVIAKRKGIL